MQNSYISSNNIKYSECTRNIDNMLSRFESDRTKIVSYLLHDHVKFVNLIWSDKSPLNIDRECLCNMGQRLTDINLDERINGKYVFNQTLSNFYVCSQCKNIGRIVKCSPSSSIPSSPINNPFYIECGNLAGKMLVLTQHHIDNIFIKFDNYPLSNILFPQIRNDIDYMGCDYFTNQIIINWYLYQELQKYKLPHLSLIYTAFICRDNGYYLSEHSDIGNISNLQQYSNLLSTNDESLVNLPINKELNYTPLKVHIVAEIIKQLFVTFQFLNKYNFSYGSINSKSITIASFLPG